VPVPELDDSVCELREFSQGMNRLVLGGSVEAVNSGDNGITRSGDGFDPCFLPHDESHIGQEPATKQLGDCNDDYVVLQRNRNNRELKGCSLWYQLEGSGFNIDCIEIYHSSGQGLFAEGGAITNLPCT